MQLGRCFPSQALRRALPISDDPITINWVADQWWESACIGRKLSLDEAGLMMWRQTPEMLRAGEIEKTVCPWCKEVNEWGLYRQPEDGECVCEECVETYQRLLKSLD